MAKKDVTLDDVLTQMNARFDAVDQRLEKRLTDIECRIANIEHRLDVMDYRIDRLEQCMKAADQSAAEIIIRLDRMETILHPSLARLQITVRDHGTRVRRLEEREGLLEEEAEAVAD